MKKTVRTIIGFALANVLSGAASAAVFDLVTQDLLYDMVATTGGTGKVVTPDANFLTGFGANDVFMRLRQQGGTGSEQGYNTTGVNQFPLTAPSGFLTALPLNSIPVVDIGGTSYIEIALGFNMTGNNGSGSLDEFQLFQGNTSNLTGYTPGPGATLATLGGNSVLFDWFGNTGADSAKLYDYHTGQSALDYLFYIPANLFTADFIYLYANMGVTLAMNDGDERWARDAGGDGFCVDLPGIDCTPQGVSEPGTLALFGLSLIALGAVRRRAKSLVPALRG